MDKEDVVNVYIGILLSHKKVEILPSSFLKNNFKERRERDRNVNDLSMYTVLHSGLLLFNVYLYPLKFL